MTVDTVSTSLITVDYGNSLQAMTAAGKYDWVNSDITNPVAREQAARSRRDLAGLRTLELDAKECLDRALLEENKRQRSKNSNGKHDFRSS
jgi:hypothetical protein